MQDNHAEELLQKAGRASMRFCFYGLIAGTGMVSAAILLHFPVFILSGQVWTLLPHPMFWFWTSAVLFFGGAAVLMASVVGAILCALLRDGGP